MIQATLINHRGAVELDYQSLARIEAPPPTATWFPIKHSVVLDRVVETLDGAGFRVEDMRLSVARAEQRFFGTLRLANRVTSECSLAIGVRNSTDQSFPIGFCVGERVFVCDNLAFHSEIVITRRHTKFGEIRFNEAVSRSVLGLHQYQLEAAERIERLQRWELTSTEADSLMLRSFETGVVSSRVLPEVIRAWRHPEHEAFQPRNGWSLLNAYTGVLKDRQKSNPQEAALQTIQLQRLLTPPEVVIHDVEQHTAL